MRRGSASKIPIDETVTCDSGSVSVSGELTDSGTDSLDLVYHECRLTGVTFSGIAQWNIHALDLTSDIVTDSNYRFPNLTISDAQTTLYIGGVFGDRIDVTNNRETITSNIVTLNPSTGDRTKASNLIISDVYDSIYYPSSYKETIRSTLFHSAHSHVEIETTTDLSYPTMSAAYSSAGVMLLKGANNSLLVLHAISDTQLSMSLDSDGDGSYDAWLTLAWPDIDTTPGQNSVPTANAGSDRKIQAGLAYRLNNNSSDPDTDFLSYVLSLLSVPAGSHTQLSEATSPTPQITPDLDGDYVISLVVNDAESSSTPATITLTAVNGAPAPSLQAWSTYQGNPSHTGYVHLQLNPANF